MDAKSSIIQPTFLFDDRKRFDAQCEHDRLRSSINSDIDIPPTADPWKQRPVDFTLKNFHPNRQKNRIQSPTEYVSPREKQSEISRTFNPAVMQPFTVKYENPTKRYSNNNDENHFQLSTRIKHDRVHRMLNTEQYKNPQLHDFRQYPNIKELGLSEFQTAYDSDPYNIRFHSNRLNTIWLQEREHERRLDNQQPISDMYRALTAKPNWESKLILPKLVYPNKYAAYTRYRNPTRTIQSAYYERVEDRLGQQQQQQKKRLNVT